MSQERLRTITIAVAQSIATLACAVVAWFLGQGLHGLLKTIGVLIIATWLLWPVKYRFEDKPKERWIRIPYLFAGFCELAVVIFDRFKGAAQSNE